MRTIRVTLALAAWLAAAGVAGCDDGGDGDADSDADTDADADEDDGGPPHGETCDDSMFFVAPGGDDGGAGTIDAPFATLARARDAARAAIAAGLPAGGVEICLRGGVYELDATLELGADDSGAAGSTVRWVAYPGETVRVSGGRRLDPTWFAPVDASLPGYARLPEAARGQVVALALGAHGVTDTGALVRRGWQGDDPQGPLELAVDGRMMELARFPNRGATDAVDPDADATVEGDLFGAGAVFAFIGRTAAGDADDGYPSYQANVGGQDYFLYHCTWFWGGAQHKYWFLSTADPRSEPNCWPDGLTSWLGQGDREVPPPLEPFGGGASEIVIARNRPIDFAEGGFLRIPEAIDDQSFRFPGERHTAWGGADDLWFQGLFLNYWADDTISGSLDGDVVRLDEPAAYGIAMGQPFLVLNLLEELDEPGEYYVDRGDGTLYLWPRAALASAEVAVTVLEQPLLRLDGAHHVSFVGVTFELSRDDLVVVDGAEEVRFDYCTFRNGGADGVSIMGSNSGLSHCTVTGTGGTAVHLAGGERPSLTPGNLSLSDSHVHDWARWDRTYHPAALVQGVGNVVEHNSLHDAPHTAILFSGNDHRFEYNDIGRVVLEANDAGAIYTGRDWGYRGTVIRYNCIHNIESLFGGSHGVYLDDAVSGMMVTYNVIYSVHGLGTMSGGGRDNVFEHNIIAGVEDAAHLSDRRARAVANDEWNGEWPDDWNLIGRLNSSYEGYRWGDPLDHQAPPWSDAYPALAVIPEDWGEVADSHWLDPEGCVFSRNLVAEANQMLADGTWGGEGAFDFYAEIDGNLEGVDPQFVDPEAGDFTLQPTSPAFTIAGFTGFPFDEIGIRD